MTNSETFEKIEAWLSGELPEAAARAFEAQMAADTALATEVERHQRGRQALDRLAEQNLQLDFARWSESLDDRPPAPLDAPSAIETPTAKTPHGWCWLIGAALLLTGMATVWFLARPAPQPEQDKTQETVPVQQEPTVPAVDTPPTVPLEKQLPNHKKPEPPQPADSQRLIAIAGTHLVDFRDDVLRQYDRTLGEEEGKNPFFTAGLQDFKNNNANGAKNNLLQVPTTDDHFPSAQEMLAWLFLQEKNYAEAARCYESFAGQNADPAVDWRLVQFYLADYQHRKAGFWKKMHEILDPANTHRFRGEAEKLKQTLQKIHILEK